uniref:RAB37, member RAS onco family n=1 Tax=Lates calcarifer TaxID=8187 RepID=A0A4W6EV75_LATCA
MCFHYNSLFLERRLVSVWAPVLQLTIIVSQVKPGQITKYSCCFFPFLLQIWDTAGQERFRSVTHAYYRDAHALLLLYDITSKSSFDNIRAWLTEIHEYAQSDVVIMLLGNKADMSSDRAIRRDEGERLAREYSVPFMETSAKTGVNVELAFTAVAKELKHRAVQHPNEPKFQIHEYIEAQKEKSGCCSYF